MAWPRMGPEEMETGKLPPALEVEPTRVLVDWTEGMRGTWRGVVWLLGVCFADFGDGDLGHGGEAEWEGRCVGCLAGMESCAGTWDVPDGHETCAHVLAHGVSA